MNEMYIVSFNSTHHAIRLDKLLGEASVRATTLPTPREITASCGISIRFLYEDIEKVKNTLVENNIEYKGIYKITRLENGTKEVEKIGDVVELKKQHACGCKEFEITRVGMDIKIKCTKCLRSIMLDRETVEKKIKKIIKK